MTPVPRVTKPAALVLLCLLPLAANTCGFAPRLIERLTPILFVENIEASLAFWHDRLGFVTTIEAPPAEFRGDEGMVFVSLERDGNEVMLQTVKSIGADIPAQASAAAVSKGFLYIEVSNLAEIEKTLGDWALVMPKRNTDYGATEIGVRSPGGHFITLAQQKR